MNSRKWERASSRSVHTYEKRPRRKTKADRYEPHEETYVSRQGSPRPRHSRKKAKLAKQNNSRVANKFRAENIKTGRLTLTSSGSLGIFKKGRTSSPISSVKVSYPNFSELKFLAKEPQAMRPRETSLYSKQHGVLPGGGTFDASNERELFRAMTDCRQLRAPYENYMPRYLNNRIFSLEDLKNLCRGLDTMCTQRKGRFVLDDATENNSYGVHHAGYGWTNTENAYSSNPGNRGERYSAQREEPLDVLLDSLEDFDQDVALEVLAELVEFGANIYELQEAGRTDYAHGLEAITSTYSYDVPRPLEEDCGRNVTIRHGEHPVISSTTQGRYGDQVISIQGHIQNSQSMEEGAAVKTPGLGFSSALEDGQFSRRSVPSLTTTHIPDDAPVQYKHTGTAPCRPFWRCNKLY